MEIVKSISQGNFDIRLSGKFTFADNPEFREILNTIADMEVQQVILHMAGVEFVDSAALGMLLLARDEAEKHRKKLVLSGAVGQVKKMFDMARFNTIFTMA